MKTAILAGNMKEYAGFCENFGLNREFYVYISEPMKLIGSRFRDYIIIGTFFDRPHASELRDLAESRINNNPQ